MQWAGKQKGSSSRSLSSDNDPILRDSNISDKLDALSNKMTPSLTPNLMSLTPSFLHSTTSSLPLMSVCKPVRPRALPLLLI